VQKYGGTSLGTPAKLEKMLGIVQQHYPKNNVIAVVSGAFSSSFQFKVDSTTILISLLTFSLTEF
jgi:aspartokinase